MVTGREKIHKSHKPGSSNEKADWDVISTMSKSEKLPRLLLGISGLAIVVLLVFIYFATSNQLTFSFKLVSPFYAPPNRNIYNSNISNSSHFKNNLYYGPQHESSSKSSLNNSAGPSANGVEKMKRYGNKIILTWFPFFGDRSWARQISQLGKDGVFNISMNSKGQARGCTLTSDRGLLKKATAVVFHGRDFNFDDLPKWRSPHQRWVFFNLESPSHTFDENKWNRLSRLNFNWTMYYTAAANSPFPYGHIHPANYTKDELDALNKRLDSFSENFAARPYDAVWFVSHCSTVGKRENLVRALFNADTNLTIKGFGGCFSSRPEPVIKKMGEAAFYSQFRFIAALENSVCTDYATEKFFNGLKVSQLSGTIPIVFGGGDYEQLLEPGAFIRINKKNIKEVASLLAKLRQPGQSALVRKYLVWQTRHVNDNRDFPIPGWRNLCRNLWLMEDTPVNSTVTDLREPLGKCIDQ